MLFAQYNWMELPQNVKDMAGLKFGRLKVVSFAGMRDPAKKPPGGMWKCECQCGKVIVLFGASLRSGNTKSCGCQKVDAVVFRNTTHGMARRGKAERVYSVWCGMKDRCSRKTYHAYHRYGGRGIKVCARWIDFLNFYSDMGPSWKPGLEIDRRNNDGDYCPENCRWVTKPIQNNNRCNNRRVTYRGKTKTVAELAAQHGKHIASRVYAGWPVEKAVETPLGRWPK